MTVWEALFRMLWRLDAANMEGSLIDGAAAVAREMGAASESVKGLALLPTTITKASAIWKTQGASATYLKSDRTYPPAQCAAAKKPKRA